MRSMLILLLLASSCYAQQPVARSTTVGNQTFFYGKTGQYMGRSSTVGRNTYYYFKAKK